MDQLREMLEGMLKDREFFVRKLTLMSAALEYSEQVKPLLQSPEYVKAWEEVWKVIDVLQRVGPGNPSITLLTQSIHRLGDSVVDLVLSYLSANNIRINLEPVSLSKEFDK